MRDNFHIGILMRFEIISLFLTIMVSLTACKPTADTADDSAELCASLTQYEHEFTRDVEEDCQGFLREVRHECGPAIIDCFRASESGPAIDACEALCW